MKKLLTLLLLIPILSFGQTQPIIKDCGGMKLYEYGSGDNALISFHGLNGRYNDAATICYDIERSNVIDLTKFKVYALQLNSGDTDWGKNDIAAVFAAVRNDGFSEVDITGLSLGGMAVIRAIAFNYDSTLTTWPRLKIKSCGIVCGKDDRNKWQLTAWSKVKIKAWHGTDDITMQYSNISKFIAGINNLGANAELISLNGVTHNAWTYAYDKEQPDNYYAWLRSLYEVDLEPPNKDPVKSITVVSGSGQVETESGKKYKLELIPID